nr:unnamed protein product [uncultured Mediterranean phage uvMED]
MAQAPQGRPETVSSSIPNWEDFPILDGIGTKDDVQVLDKSYTDRKTGRRVKNEIDYVNWAKCLRLLREHAKGWVPGYKTWVDENGKEHIVHEMPDGTGAVVVFFRAPTGSGFLDTEDFCQPILDGKNPAKLGQCSALKATNAIKRGWAAAAAAHFGLFSELWSKDEMEDPFLNESASTEQSAKLTKKASNTPAPEPTPAPVADARTQADEPGVDLNDMRARLKAQLVQLHAEDQDLLPFWRKGLLAQFPKDSPKGISADAPGLDNCTDIEHLEWTQRFVERYLATKNAF